MGNHTAQRSTLLSALGEQLARRGYRVEPSDDGDGLHVAGVDASRPRTVTVTCQERPEDPGQLWFYQRDRWDTLAEREPVIEANREHFADALVLLAGVLTPRDLR